MVFLFSWYWRWVLAAGAVLLLGLTTPACRASQMALQEQQLQESWKTSLNAGLNLTRGNSKNLLVNASVVSEYEKDRDVFRLYIQGNYGESAVKDNGTNTERTTVQNVRGVAEYQRLFSRRNYAYANASVNHDHIAGIDYRGIVGPGLGHYFFRSERLKLNAEAGIAYVCQRLAGNIDNNTVNFRVAQRWVIKLLDTSKIWETIEYLPAICDFGNYLINLEIGTESAISDRWNLRVVLQNQYDSRPAPGKECNDLQIIAGVGYQL